MKWLLNLLRRLFFGKNVSFGGKRSEHPQIKLSYRPQKSLFTPSEKRFLEVLESIAGDVFRVYGKVRISDILTPDVNKWEKGSGWHWLFSQISQKHVDFVIVDKQFNLVCAVELNDSTHELPERQKRDVLVTEAFASAKIPLVMINAKSRYFEKEIADAIASVVVKFK
ncbi:DUF2726 domain-containing protein [Hydrogenovibrio sp. JE_KL2]|uniref:DUF2726 domain-containing protein n=1 Tax=Hydrogenovibrio sp. JE_KL2 TaxID=2651188 RepID=UPI00128E74FC|nr:DUF2726 domain-containing protein [Hydrogenovibrio sp. JE_KL2]MPQ76996.1 DUF2726 domain-containing protein [Hydrogenovibrio sp. JE_KL2]